MGDIMEYVLDNSETERKEQPTVAREGVRDKKERGGGVFQLCEYKASFK